MKWSTHSRRLTGGSPSTAKRCHSAHQSTTAAWPAPLTTGSNRTKCFGVALCRQLVSKPSAPPTGAQSSAFTKTQGTTTLKPIGPRTRTNGSIACHASGVYCDNAIERRAPSQRLNAIVVRPTARFPARHDAAICPLQEPTPQLRYPKNRGVSETTHPSPRRTSAVALDRVRVWATTVC